MEYAFKSRALINKLAGSDSCCALGLPCEQKSTCQVVSSLVLSSVQGLTCELADMADRMERWS